MRKRIIPLSLTAIRLSDLRNESNKTQSEVAEDLEISEASIKKYERGGTNLQPDKIRKLSKYYNVDSDYILGLSDKKSKATTSAAETTGLSESAISFISSLNENNKLVLERLLSDEENFTAMLDSLVPLLYFSKNIEIYKNKISDLSKSINNAGKVNLMETRKTLEENKLVTAPYYASQAFGEMVKNAF